jgi:hypothetical protein
VLLGADVDAAIVVTVLAATAALADHADEFVYPVRVKFVNVGNVHAVL